MTQAHDLLARTLRESAGALAAYAAHDLLAARPEAGKAYGPSAAGGWRGFLAKRLADLAAAAAAGEPGLFAGQIRWARTAFRARGVPVEDLRAAVEALQAVLERELPEATRRVAREYLGAAIPALEGAGDASAPALEPDTPERRLALAYVLALLEGDSRRAMALVLDAVRDGRPVRDLYQDVLMPAMAETGRMWLVGEACVAEEHFITATTASLVHRLMAGAEAAPANGKTAVVASVEGNRHDLASQMLANLLELAGWRVVRLGADVPVLEVVVAVRAFEADCLLLSASLVTQVEALGQTVREVRASAGGQGVKIVVGGAALDAVPQLAERLGADACDRGVGEAVAMAGRLVGLSTTPSP